MASDPDAPEFDAVAAAKELDDLLGEASSSADASAAAAKDATYIASLETEIEELNNLLAQKDAQLERAVKRADDSQVEIEAASKRLANAASKELEQRTRKVLEAFLPVVDDLDRAIAAARNHPDSADVVEGMELVRRSMLSRFGQFGVVHAPALGEVFDPQRHDAMATVAVSDPAQDGRVIDVLREGYLIGEETLRPAGVAVGKRAG
jgi:molecular chaperone GrpE